MFSRKAITFIAAGAAAVAVAGGTYGIVNATSSSGSSTANAATGKVIPFKRGQPSAQTAVGKVPQGWTPGSGTIVSGTNAARRRQPPSPRTRAAPSTAWCYWRTATTTCT